VLEPSSSGSGIAARGQHIDEAVLDDDLEPDVRIGPGTTIDGSAGVEPERSGRPVAKGVHDVDRLCSPSAGTPAPPAVGRLRVVD
jgi:hypothetical protein